MTANEVDSKVNELRSLRGFEAEVREAIKNIETLLKAEMTERGTDILEGRESIVNWKTFVTTRFDSAAFKLSHADLFQQYSRATTSRRFVIA